MSDEPPTSAPEWREFEKLAADIQRQLAPAARVETNFKLLGKSSGVERQIDILVEQTVGQYSIRVVIDCKDYKTAVDVKDVEAFMGLAADVGANKGAMVAACGFTSTAKHRARDAGIDLFRLVDTNNTKWRTYVSIPCVIRDAFIQKCSFRFSGTGPFRMELKDYPRTSVFRADGSAIDYLQNFVLERWKSDDIPAKPGEYGNIPAAKEDTYIKTSGQLYRVGIEIHAFVAEHLYFGQLPLDDVRGFSDEVSGGLVTTAFTTATINIAEIEKSWERINSIEQLSVKPVLVLKFKSIPPRFDGTTSPFESH
jgi:hypothetical protein